jgi:toxin ParE1/3/4
VQVRLTASAVSDLVHIRDYIGKFNPAAASRIAARLIEAAESLEDFPEKGQAATRGRRVWPVVPPYVIRYRIEGQTIWILRFRHGRRRPVD